MDQQLVFNMLCKKVEKALKKEKLSRAELVNLAMVVEVLETEREIEILFTGIERSREEENQNDVYFRLLEKVYKYHCYKNGGEATPFIQRIVHVLKKEGLKGRLSTFILSGNIPDIPEFYRKQILG